MVRAAKAKSGLTMAVNKRIWDSRPEIRPIAARSMAKARKRVTGPARYWVKLMPSGVRMISVLVRMGDSRALRCETESSIYPLRLESGIERDRGRRLAGEDFFR